MTLEIVQHRYSVGFEITLKMPVYGYGYSKAQAIAHAREIARSNMINALSFHEHNKHLDGVSEFTISETPYYTDDEGPVYDLTNNEHKK